MDPRMNSTRTPNTSIGMASPQQSKKNVSGSKLNNVIETVMGGGEVSKPGSGLSL